MKDKSVSKVRKIKYFLIVILLLVIIILLKNIFKDNGKVNIETANNNGYEYDLAENTATLDTENTGELKGTIITEDSDVYRRGNYNVINNNNEVTVQVLKTKKAEVIKKIQIEAEKIWNIPDEYVDNYRVTVGLIAEVNGNETPVVDEQGNRITRVIEGNGKEIFTDLRQFDGEEEINYIMEELLIEESYINSETGEKEWKPIDIETFKSIHLQLPPQGEVDYTIPSAKNVTVTYIAPRGLSDSTITNIVKYKYNEDTEKYEVVAGKYKEARFSRTWMYKNIAIAVDPVDGSFGYYGNGLEEEATFIAKYIDNEQADTIPTLKDAYWGPTDIEGNKLAGKANVYVNYVTHPIVEGQKPFESVVAIRRATSNTDPGNGTYRRVDTEEEGRLPVWMWIDGDILYYYTEADTIKLNRYAGYLFRNYKALKDINELANWDWSEVKETSYMFSGCEALKNITALKAVEQAKNIAVINAMFNECYSLSNISSLRYWDVSNLGLADEGRKNSGADSLFMGAPISDFTAISNWDVSNNTAFNHMFQKTNITMDSLPAFDSWIINTPESDYKKAFDDTSLKGRIKFGNRVFNK